jgi:hypothetical protein
VWLAVLSDQLPIIATVGRHPAVQLIGRRPLPGRRPKTPFLTALTTRPAYAGLPAVSRGCPPPRGRLPTCSAPVRRVIRPKPDPLDLHALGTPPALILSQDQTLHQTSPCGNLAACMLGAHVCARVAPRQRHALLRLPRAGCPSTPACPSPVSKRRARLAHLYDVPRFPLAQPPSGSSSVSEGLPSRLPDRTQGIAHRRCNRRPA